jgi:1,2-diacylglycerol 3-alpha-glucosyltransferase
MKMKILHCCLSNYYIDDFGYQENLLVREGVKQGNEVYVLASTESLDTNGQLTYMTPGQYHGTDGAMVMRVPYRKFLPHMIMRKIRTYPGIFQILCVERPDVVLFHGTCAFELLTITMYCRLNRSVKLFIDSHEDFHNSARSFLSKWVLHYLFYRPIFRHALRWTEKVLCISVETMDFIHGFYGCPKSKIEYFPLGGNIQPDADYEQIRSDTRRRYGISNSDLVFIQTGKFNSKKKLIESLTAFTSIPTVSGVKYLVVGHIEESLQGDFDNIVRHDARMQFAGWVDSRELERLLCASDIYVQPGTQSATLQTSICCRCSVIVDDVPSHYPFVNGNGWIIKNTEQLCMAFTAAIEKSRTGKLSDMCRKSLQIAKELLDYSKMAKRLME